MVAGRRLSRRNVLQTASLAGAGLAALRARGQVAAAPRLTRVQGEPVTLRVWNTEEEELQPVIDAFTAANPNIQIDFQYYPWGEFWDKLNAAYAAGDPPDVHRQDDDEIPFFAQRETLMLMDEALGGLPQDRLYWNIVESTRVAGELVVSIPAFRVGNLFYNKTLFDEAGIAPPPAAYPSEAWTWDAFAETARAMSKPDQQQFGVGGVNSMDFLLSMIRANGGEVLSQDCLSFRLGEPASVEVMQKVHDLMFKDRAAVDPTTSEAFGDEMFAQGRLAMSIGQTREVPEDPEFEWGYAGWPIFQGKEPVVFAAIECYGVPATTEHPAEASAFAAFLMSDEAQQILAKTKNIIPINRAAATDIWVPASANDRGFLLDAADYGKTLPFAVGFGRVQDLTWPIFGEIWTGQRSIEEALAEAVPLADQALAEAGGCLGVSS